MPIDPPDEGAPVTTGRPAPSAVPPQGPFAAALDRAWEAFKVAWLELSALVFASWLLAMGLALAASFLLLDATATPGAVEPSGVAAAWSTALNLLYQVVGLVLFGSLALYAADVLAGTGTRRGWLLYPWRRLGALAAFPVLYLLLLLPTSALAYAFLPLPEDPALWDPNSFDVGRMAVGAVVGFAGAFGLAFLALPLFAFGILEVLYARRPLPQALANAWRMGRGRRWSTLGTVLFGSLIQFGGMLALCIGVFPGTALALLLFVAYYLEVRARAGIAPVDGPVEATPQDAPPPALA